MATTFLPYEIDEPQGLAQGTLVCIPGLNSGAYLFTAARHALPQWRIIRFATPGVPGVPLPLPFTAASYAKYVAKHLAALGPSPLPWVLLGHSLGGYAAQELLKLQPATFTRAVLVSTSLGQPYTAQDLSKMEAKLGQSFWAYIQKLEANAADGLLPMFGKSWPVQNPKGYHAFLAARDAAKPEGAGLLAQVSAGALFTSARWAKKMTTPTLVLHGTDDILISAASGKSLAAALPQGRWLLLHGVGHFPLLEHAQFWPYVAQFAQGAMLGEPVIATPGWKQLLGDFWGRSG